jgi:predicted RNase H-like nuclease (RuvC/YqgF family)
MTDTQRITQLESQLREALNRINQLEEKIETIRGNVNGNIDGHTRVLNEISTHLGIRKRFTFKTGIDVAR